MYRRPGDLKRRRRRNLKFKSRWGRFMGNDLKDWQVHFNRRDRRRAKDDLIHGREPFPWQTKGRAKWEAW